MQEEADDPGKNIELNACKLTILNGDKPIRCFLKTEEPGCVQMQSGESIDVLSQTIEKLKNDPHQKFLAGGKNFKSTFAWPQALS